MLILPHVRYRIRTWLQMMRLQFLIATAMFFSFGYLTGSDDLEVDKFFFGLTSVLLAQLSVGLINEYTDWKGDRFAVRTTFSGGSGVLASGAAAPSDALAAAIVLAGLSIACAIEVGPMMAGSYLFLAVLVAGLLLGWALSLRPFRLIGTGAGEAIATALISAVVPYLGYYLGGSSDLDLVPYLIPLALFTFSFQIASEFPDRVADIRSRKTNMLYRLGLRRCGILVLLCSFAGFGMIAFLLITGKIGWWGWSLFALLPFVWAGGTVMGFSRYFDRMQATVTVWFMSVLLGVTLIMFILGKV